LTNTHWGCNVKREETETHLREFKSGSMSTSINIASLSSKLGRMTELTCNDKMALTIGKPMDNARLVKIKEKDRYHYYLVERGVKHHVLNADVDDLLMMMTPLAVRLDSLLGWKNGEQIRHANYEDSDEANDIAEWDGDHEDPEMYMI